MITTDSIAPHANITSEPFSGTRLTATTSTPYSTVLSRFRDLVPPVSRAIFQQRDREAFEVTMIKEDVEAGLCVPVELLLVGTEDGGTRCVAQLPSGLIAGHEKGKQNERLVQAVDVLDKKLLALIADLMA